MVLLTKGRKARLNGDLEEVYRCHECYPTFGFKMPKLTYTYAGVGAEFRKGITKEVADSLLESWHLKKYFIRYDSFYKKTTPSKIA